MKTPKLIYWIPAVLWALFIFYLSSDSSPAAPGNFPDWFYHIFLYFILSILLYIAISKYNYANKAVYLSVLIATIYGIFDEFHQTLTPGRIFDLKDILFNFLGSLLIYFKRIRLPKH